MVGIGPEVVDQITVARRVGDPVVGFEDVERCRTQPVELVRLEEFGLGLRVAITHPGQRVVALHLFEPAELVGLLHDRDRIDRVSPELCRAMVSRCLLECAIVNS